MSQKNKTPKELIKDSWENFKEAGSHLVWFVWNTFKWTYNTVDALDKVLWNRIWEKSNKITNLIRNNILKTLIGLSVLTYSWIEINQKITNKHEERKEKIEDINDNLDNDVNAYWDNYQIEQWLQEKNPDKWIHLIKDKWLTFYVVQPEDIKEKIEKRTQVMGKWKNKKSKIVEYKRKYLDIQWIRKKLMNLDEYAYLKRSEYDEKTRSFNVPSFKIIDKEKIEHIKRWNFLIPIPMDSKYREITSEQFVDYCHSAITEIKENKVYWEKIKELLKKTSEKEIVANMLAFARSETTEEYTDFTQNIWAVELHRWEDHMWAFSYSYFHILMEKNKDWSNWPWLRARINLWLSEWDCYHPKNSAKLFLWYWIEKTKSKQGWITSYLPITEKNITKVATTYNGSSSYSNKLLANYNYSKKILKIKTKS